MHKGTNEVLFRNMDEFMEDVKIPSFVFYIILRTWYDMTKFFNHFVVGGKTKTPA